MKTIQELKGEKRWVATKNKVPIDPISGGNAKVNDTKTWHLHEEILPFADKYDGVGIMFSDGLCGIDIDDVDLTDENSEKTKLAQGIISLMNSYTEKSPSGRGLHILFYCDVSRLPTTTTESGIKLDPKYRQKSTKTGVEAYCAGITKRYFTFTGDVVDGREIVEERTEQFLLFIEEYMQKNKEGVLPQMTKSKNYDKFLKLFFLGDWKSEGYGSQSEADLALCSLLASRCKGEIEEIDKYFRMSKLMREKWEREDYRTATLLKAVTSSEFAAEIEDGGSETKDKPKLTLNYFRAWLRNEGISIRHNVITKKVDISGIDPKHSKEHLPDNLPVILYDKIQFLFKNVTVGRIQELISVLSTDNKYNPVLEKIRSVTWDEVERVSELIAILNITDIFCMNLFYKWLWQSMSLLSNSEDEPFGADGVLILQGKGGIGKTSFFRKLGLQSSWFGEGRHLDFKNKDTIMLATSTWITELGEIESTFRSNMSMFKSFVTSPVDKIRPPYGRTAVEALRRTSPCGTCNSQEFLVDPDGNRRFWVIPIEDVDLQALENFNVLQLWAEVDLLTQTYDPQGFRLTKNEQKKLESHNEEFRRLMRGECEVSDIISTAQANSTGYIWEEQTITEFKSNFSDELRNIDASSIGKALSRLGIAAKRVKKGGTVERKRFLPKRNFNNDKIAMIGTNQQR